MDHDHHGGGGGVGSRQAINRSLAQSYWYLIAGAIGFAALVRVVNYLETRRRYIFTPCWFCRETR